MALKHTTLKKLGYRSYEDYLAGRHWQVVRAHFLRSASVRRNLQGRPMCSVCDRTWGLQLHHITYKRLGFERAGDLVLLCDYHHNQVHGRRSQSAKLVGHSELRKADGRRIKIQQGRSV